MVNYCRYCGSKLGAGARFCRSCGKQIGGTTPEETVQETIAKTETTAKPAKTETTAKAAKAIREILEITCDAKETSGEMRITLNDSQKSCITGLASRLTCFMLILLVLTCTTPFSMTVYAGESKAFDLNEYGDKEDYTLSLDTKYWDVEGELAIYDRESDSTGEIVLGSVQDNSFNLTVTDLADGEAVIRTSGRFEADIPEEFVTAFQGMGNYYQNTDAARTDNDAYISNEPEDYNNARFSYTHIAGYDEEYREIVYHGYYDLYQRMYIFLINEDDIPLEDIVVNKGAPPTWNGTNSNAWFTHINNAADFLEMADLEGKTNLEGKTVKDYVTREITGLSIDEKQAFCWEEVSAVPSNTDDRLGMAVIDTRQYFIIDRLPQYPGFFAIKVYEISYQQQTGLADDMVDRYSGIYDEAYNRIVNVLPEAVAATDVNIVFGESNSFEEDVPANFPPIEYPAGNAEIYNNASGEAGESRLPIPAIIGVVLGGGLIGIGLKKKSGKKKTKGTESGKESNQDRTEDEDEQLSRFDMVIYKEYGRVLNDGAEYEIFARIEEITASGKVIKRDDLTSLIQINGKKNVSILGNKSRPGYKGVCFRVETGNDKMSAGNATIGFSCSAGGASITDYVVFDIKTPRIVFPDRQPGFDMFIEAIAGDNGEYRVRFLLENASAEPKDLSGSCDGFDISFEQTEYMYTYDAVLKNHTAPIERKICGFSEKKSVTAGINVTWPGLALTDFFSVYLNPEGLCAYSDTNLTEDGKICISSFVNEERGDLDPEYKPTRIEYTLAARGENGARLVRLSQDMLKFDKLRGTDEDSSNIAAKYRYRIDTNRLEEGITFFNPQTMLYRQEKPYIVILPVSCSYMGHEYALDVPLYLRGKEPDLIAKWAEEYKKLLSRIVNFSDPEEIEENLGKARQLCGTPENQLVSVEDMHLMGKRLIRKYMNYMSKEAGSEIAWGIAFDWLTSGAEVAKFLGDCAFSFLVNAYMGPVADAILSPAKDIFTSSVGEWGVSYIYGTEFNIEELDFVGALYSAGDGISFNAAQGSLEGLVKDGGINAGAMKKAAAIIAAYYVYLALTNYLKKWNEKGESDLWGALTDAFKDLSVNAMKAGVSMLFKKWLDSKSFREGMGKKIESYMQKNFKNLMDTKMNNFQEDWAQKLRMEGELKKLTFAGADEVDILRRDIAEKYITEVCGKGAAWLADKASTSEFSIGDDGEVLFTFRIYEEEGRKPILCTISITKVINFFSCGLFGMLYDSVFGSVPVAEHTVSIPNEPTLA